MAQMCECVWKSEQERVPSYLVTICNVHFRVHHVMSCFPFSRERIIAFLFPGIFPLVSRPFPPSSFILSMLSILSILSSVVRFFPRYYRAAPGGGGIPSSLPGTASEGESKATGGRGGEGGGSGTTSSALVCSDPAQQRACEDIVAAANEADNKLADELEEMARKEAEAAEVASMALLASSRAEQVRERERERERETTERDDREREKARARE